MNARISRLALSFCLAVSGAALPVVAQPPKRPMSVDDQFRLVETSVPLLSPDGQWVLYPVERRSLSENARHATRWLSSTRDPHAAKELLREGDSSPMWAPDSRSVFFLRSVTTGDVQSRELFEQRVDEGVAVQRSHIGAASGDTWQLSRDGTFFLMIRDETPPSGSGAGSDVVFVDEGSNGQVRYYWSNLWLYDLKKDQLTRITNRDWSINSADLSPDGRQAVVAARPDNRRNTRERSELFIVALPSGAIRQLTSNAVPEESPQWTPDGKSVLFFAVRLDRWTNGNGDLWLIDAATGKTRDITPRHKGRYVRPVFSPDGASIFLTSGWGTTRFPARIDVATGRATALMQTEGTVRIGSWSRDRRTYAYTYSDAVTPADVYIARVEDSSDRQQRITDLNPWVRQEIALASVQRVRWSSFDGLGIEGLLHLPPETKDIPTPLPMVVHVNCGPGCNWQNDFSPMTHVWAGLGYAQLSPNVRGSINYDDEFLRANTFDIGGGDRRDIIAGVDAMIARKIADPQRLGIRGWSYGGILAGFTITQTTRFKAASLGAMVSDWISEYGAGASWDMELRYIGGNPWTKPERWRERSSLTHAHRVRTPTLLHHGDDDTADSPFQSMNFFVALRKFGTPARLIRYPGAGHDLDQPRHVRLRDQQDVLWMQWFVRGIASPGIPDAPPP